jgi:microcin C transport system ATP-binding protein
MSSKPLLSIENLSLEMGRFAPRNPVTHKVNLHLHAGEKVALVGESGSGKSVTALSVLRLHDKQTCHYASGSCWFSGKDLLACSDSALRQIRGKDIAMIFQEPMTSLNPVYPIGTQVMEALLLHENISKSQARQRAIELLQRTGIDHAEKRMAAFPHMLSGGQRQRVMIAMALACQPKLLIADEPTTALDVTIQLQIIELLEDLQKETGMAVLLISHDLNVVRRFAERIYVMQNGEIVEEAQTEQLFNAPKHPYTQRLLHSRPQPCVDLPVVNPKNKAPLLQAEGLTCHFSLKQGFFKRVVGEVRAVDDVTLALYEGETLGIVGESGSGKTTLGLCLLRLQACTGQIQFEGCPLHQRNQQQLRPLRKFFQVVFQDPYSSLSPRMTIEDIVGEGLKIHFPQLNKAQRRERIIEILQEVGLSAAILSRYPHEFSGGQRQRIAIARVVILEPKLILLDEPTSALDVSIQKQVLELLRKLQRKHQISYLFISHDLAVVRAMAHRVIVMQHGQFVEQGPTEELFLRPKQPYTRTLLQASLVNVV